jgi:hypothetical protein
LGPHLSLTPCFRFRSQANCFLSLTSCFLVSPTLCLFLRQPPSLLSDEPLSFLFGATASLFFGLPACVVFSLASFGRVGTHLCFDLGAQTRFVFGASLCFGFSLAAQVFFGATTRGLVREALCFFGGLDAGICASLNAGNLFFDGSEPHFSPATQFVFLGLLAGLGFQIVPFLFSTTLGVPALDLTQTVQLGFVSPLRGHHLRIYFRAAGFFHSPHAIQFLLRAAQFLFSDLSPMSFLCPRPRLNFDALLFLTRPVTRGFFFHLTPAFLFDPQSIFRRQTRSFYFSPAGLLFCAKTH